MHSIFFIFYYKIVETQKEWPKHLWTKLNLLHEIIKFVEIDWKKLFLLKVIM